MMKQLEAAFKKLIAFALVSISDIIADFDTVIEEFGEDVDDFVDYFEKHGNDDPKRRGK
jgi:hypothetical protein